MSAEGSALTSGEYIRHHLENWQIHWDASPVVHQAGEKASIINFSVANLDSVLFSAILGVLGCFVMWLAARKATSGVPGRFQAAVELLAEMVNNQAKDIIHNEKSRQYIVPMAMFVMVWVFLMNAMDFLPVDLLPVLRQWVSSDPANAYLRVVPTADLSVTMGMAVFVLLLRFYYSVKVKGLGGWGHELISAPFGTSKNPVFWLLLAIVNLLMQIIEFLANTVSHGMRLFGNMYAGELVFLLIALMGGAFVLNPTEIGFWLGAGHVVAGLVWAIFHILIVTLQAFIFMMLTLIYLGQAHDSH